MIDSKLTIFSVMFLGMESMIQTMQVVDRVLLN